MATLCKRGNKFQVQVRRNLHFLKLQKNNPFVGEYKRFLGHFEFDDGFTPLVNEFSSESSPTGLNFWLVYWISFQSMALKTINQTDAIIDDKKINDFKVEIQNLGAAIEIYSLLKSALTRFTANKVGALEIDSRFSLKKQKVASELYASLSSVKI